MTETADCSTVLANVVDKVDYWYDYHSYNCKVIFFYFLAI